MPTKVILDTYNCPMEVKGRLVLDIIKMATEENRFIASWAAAGMAQVYLGSTTESCQKFFMPNRTMVVCILHMFDYYSTSQ